MRIGVLGHGFMHWGGGIDFLRTIVTSMQQLEPKVEIHLLLPTRGALVALASGAEQVKDVARKVLRKPTPHRQRLGVEIRQALADIAEHPFSVHEIDQGSHALARAARRLSLDALLPAFEPLPSAFPVPWVGYVFDFQHRYYPTWFKPAELRSRDQHFQQMATQATTLIVNARAVADDIHRFLPAVKARVFALPFGAAPNRDWLRPPSGAPAKYGVHRPYFIVCNQFWKHKDHRTAFAGFAYWLKPTAQADLVCTGDLKDYRDPDYMASLRVEMEQLGITSRVHLLGHVPKADQIDLLRDSVALVQPTLFEGGPGGGATFDAVAVGVPCILSDIGVNREIGGDGIEFFKAGDANDLARSMQLAWEQRMTNRRGADDLMAAGRLRRRACGQQLLCAIEHAKSRALATKGH